MERLYFFLCDLFLRGPSNNQARFRGIGRLGDEMEMHMRNDLFVQAIIISREGYKVL